MTETTVIDTPSTHNETYRLCGACGVLMRRKDPFCPECGAEAGAEHPAEHRNTPEKSVFTVIIALLLLGALALLGQNREGAMQIESQRLSRLAPLDAEQLRQIEEQASAQASAQASSQASDHASSQGTAPADPAPEVPQTAFQPAPQPEPGPEPSPFEDDEDPFGGDAPFAPPDPQPEVTQTEPEPAPLSRAERIQQRRAELTEEYTRVLNENHPMYRPGERVTLRLADGTSQTGVLLQLAGGQVQMRMPTGEAQWFFSRQLAPETRVRVDPSERDALVQERAWEEALREIQNTP